MSGNATTRAASGMRPLPRDDAARLLGVPASALEQWSRELDFPADVGEGAPAFPCEEIEALRQALATAHSVEGAIRAARRDLDRPV